MNMMMRILGFLAVAVLGYASVFIVFIIGLNIVGHLPADQYIRDFNMSFLGGSLICCILGTGLGVLQFFTRGTAQKILTWLPLALPALYSTAMMIVFSI